ncbi:MAG: M16 family metallopeptidase [Cyclobacteriaceae bacterium]
MIAYHQFTLDNGLQVLVHEDHTTPLAVVNLLYNVGSRDEDEERTGFAHLFEHLMFGGSQNISSFDEPLQKVGGENNAFTSPDMTNYYLTLPADNLETGFWLESDRMLSLSFDPKVLEVQRKVVIEEFKQRYLNQPYGDAWLKLRPLAYKKHPYRWATIGKDINHIERATLADVKGFFKKFYHPTNAYLVVAGHVTLDRVKQLCQKWFGPIPAGEKYDRKLPKEPAQTEKRTLHVEADVPLDAIYKVYHMPGRYHQQYHQADLAGDVLGRGKSSRFFQQLVKGQKLFSDLHAYVTGSIDPGLVVVQGNLNQGVDHETAEAGIDEVINNLIKNGTEGEELQKVKNQAESTLVFSEVELLNRAMNLAFGAVAGNPDYINQESQKIQSVTSEEIKTIAGQVLRDDNSATLYYHKSAP